MKKVLSILLFLSLVGCATFMDIRPEDSQTRKAGAHLARASNVFFFGLLCGTAGTIVLMKSNPGKNAKIYLPLFGAGAIANIAAWLQLGEAGDILNKPEK